MGHKLLAPDVKKRLNELETTSDNQIPELSRDEDGSNRSERMVAVAKG
jgi:hypothetical protein